MIIEDDIWETYIKQFIQLGIEWLQNTPLYYEAVNNKKVARLLNEHNVKVPHFLFLDYVLTNNKITECPNCGHYNDNVECPIIRCELCDHEWKINTPFNNMVCDNCIAAKTLKCKREVK